MREKLNHLYVNNEERKLLLHSLVELKNQLIQQGRYADFSYIAGLYDALRILVVIFPDRWDMEQVQKALCFKLKTE